MNGLMLAQFAASFMNKLLVLFGFGSTRDMFLFNGAGFVIMTEVAIIFSIINTSKRRKAGSDAAAANNSSVLSDIREHPKQKDFPKCCEEL